MPEHGYTTACRTKMLEFLQASSARAVSVREIGEFLRQNEISVNVTTIYRYLDKLERDGTVLSYTAEGGKMMVYQYVDRDRRCDEHLHLQCIRCGRMMHLDCKFMEEITKHIQEEHDFQMQCKNSVIYGICKPCRIAKNAGQEK